MFMGNAQGEAGMGDTEMILISTTYTIVSEKSAEHGDFSEQGFVSEDVEYSFIELVRLIKSGFTNTSSWPATGSTTEWLENDPESDYESGDEEVKSIHYSRNNHARSAKYWKKAFRAAGLIK